MCLAVIKKLFKFLNDFSFIDSDLNENKSHEFL